MRKKKKPKLFDYICCFVNIVNKSQYSSTNSGWKKTTVRSHRNWRVFYFHLFLKQCGIDVNIDHKKEKKSKFSICLSCSQTMKCSTPLNAKWFRKKNNSKVSTKEKREKSVDENEKLVSNNVLYERSDCDDVVDKWQQSVLLYCGDQIVPFIFLRKSPTTTSTMTTNSIPFTNHCCQRTFSQIINQVRAMLRFTVYATKFGENSNWIRHSLYQSQSHIVAERRR